MSGGVRPVEDLPTDLVAALNDLTDDQLRTVVSYARDRLRERDSHSIADDIVAGPGEEIVSVEERAGYVRVVKREPCGESCPDCPHGPYLYHVYPEPHPDDDTRLRWVLLGGVSEDAIDTEE